MPSQDPVLIVGLGLAGACLALRLKSRGFQVHALEPGKPDSSSRVAAGIINPVTGFRFVRSWELDRFLPAALDWYRQLESLAGIRLLEPFPIFRAIQQEEDIERFESKTAFPDMAPLMSGPASMDDYSGKLRMAPYYARIAQGYRLNLPLLLDLGCQACDKVLQESWDHDRLEFTGRKLQYQGRTYAAVICCQGMEAASDPCWDWIPFTLYKGEILEVEIPGLPQTAILKQQIELVPLGGQRFWVGSSNSWEWDNTGPTQVGRAFLESRLREILQLPFRVLNHQAAIRPTIRDRRPVVGAHPDLPGLYILNGLGTKGSLMAPWLAEYLAGRLEGLSALWPVVDPARFHPARRT